MVVPVPMVMPVPVMVPVTTSPAPTGLGTVHVLPVRGCVAGVVVVVIVVFATAPAIPAVGAVMGVLGARAATGRGLWTGRGNVGLGHRGPRRGA